MFPSLAEPGSRTDSPTLARPNGVVLDLEEVTLRYGSVAALQDVNLQVRRNEVVALVGPNGAGKTSLFNCVSGFVRPSSGSVNFLGTDVTAANRHEIARAGVGRMFQNLSLFDGATVMENVLVGRHHLMRSSIAANLLLWRRSRREDVVHRAAVEEILDLLGIHGLRDSPAGGLPYGTRKRVELARALAMEPSLLLMDEPVAGMNPAETEELGAIIRRVRAERDLSILVVEHDMSMVMSLADWIIVLDFGQVIAQGVPADIRRNTKVREAYLGTSPASSTTTSRVRN
jgi:branched-chain amino acid transport system ATP-binding protein